MAMIKPCPLCGNPPDEDPAWHEGGIGGDYLSGWIIKCKRCGLILLECKTKRIARAKWNKREGMESKAK